LVQVTDMKRLPGLVVASAATVALALFVGARPAPAAEPGDGGANADASTALEFVGRAEQNGASIAIFGYVTRVAGVDDARIFAASSPSTRNENTARISFSASTTVAQSFMVLPPPATPSVFDVDSAGTLTFFFSDAPAARNFDNPESFAAGTPIASYALRFQDIVAALVGVDPTRGVVDGNGELCQTSASSFRLAGDSHRLGHPGQRQSIFTHGWTTRTSPNPPQSLTQFGGRTSILGDGRC
jgi:hypothetical protein